MSHLSATGRFDHVRKLYFVMTRVVLMNGDSSCAVKRMDNSDVLQFYFSRAPCMRSFVT